MKKLLLITLSILNAYAMEIEITTKPTRKPFISCWFLTLPIEVRDLIASFLTFYDFETEEEFIKRTEVKTEYRIQFPILFNDKDHFPPDPDIAHAYAYAYCPNNKIMLLNRIEDCLIAVVDRKTNTPLHTLKLNEYCYKTAISSDGNLFGNIIGWRKRGTLTITNISDIPVAKEKSEFCKISDIPKTKKQRYIIPSNFEINSGHPSIFFNKQGTHLIVHGIDDTRSDDESQSQNSARQYMIIPLSIIIPDSHNTPTLTKYFRQRGVCKDFLKQIT